MIDLSWKDMYIEFGRKLLIYKNDRRTLIEKIKNVFRNKNIPLPKLEKDNNLQDIDPFTIFALFNKKHKVENRIKVLSGIKDEFNLTSNVPTGFDAVPRMMNMRATFYWFRGDRGADDIQHLWDVFVAAYAYIDNKNDDTKNAFISAFDIAEQQAGVLWTLTTGLFWAMPDDFLPLDSISRWYITEFSSSFSDDIKGVFKSLPDGPTGATYLNICDMVKTEILSNTFKYHDYAHLSYDAFTNAEIENSKRKAEKDAKNEEDNSMHYWMYSPGENAFLWDECTKEGTMLLGWGEMGNLNAYPTKNSIKDKMRELYNSDSSFRNNVHAVWQFSKTLKPGDVVYAKKGSRKLIGRGIVESDYCFDDQRSDEYKNYRKIKWTNVGEWEHPGNAVTKVLTDITQYEGYAQELEEIFASDENNKMIQEQERKYGAYTKDSFLNEIFMNGVEYDRLKGLLMHEKNIILQGAPGVGKTFIAKRLAYSILGEENPERVEVVQFHQSYSYEDFVIGYRPSDNQTFELTEGVFYRFCKRAEEDDVNNPYFFIIDEINRGNMSKIFGELFMLVEKDKRGISLPLLYGKRKFNIPKNVYIIGTMNTADRSLAIIDYALRRRFAFYTVKPQFDNETFEKYISDLDNEKLENLINEVKLLNNFIVKDETLGEGFCIGHSYFSNLDSVNDDVLYNIVEYNLIQLLKEYWFDELSKVTEWSNKLRESIK